MRYMLHPPLKFDLSGEMDKLFEKAVEIVVKYNRASASLLQRKLSTGYAQAARIIDQLEAAGVVNPSDGAKPREVLIHSLDEYKKKGKPQKTKQEDVFKAPANYKVPSGLELSKKDKTPWGKQLGDVVKSEEFKKSRGFFSLVLGFDDEGKLQLENIADLGNLIIVGNPLSKKENWLDTILATLLLKHSPKELRLILIDPNHYFDLYNGIPHLLAPVITGFDMGISALRWAISEEERRMKLFTNMGVRRFDSYNKLPKVEPLPRILIFHVSNWADIERTDSMALLSSTGPKAGIHLFVVANRLSDKNLSPDIKANIPTRAVFTVSSTQDSRLAGVKGAENLGEGEMLYKQGNNEPKKLVTVCTTEINVKEVVKAVKEASK